MKAIIIPPKNPLPDKIPIPDQILELLKLIATLLLDIDEEDKETIRKIHDELDEIEHELRK